MKTDFQTKFLQHLLNKKDNAGFTLIELLVVIIIIGILSAIALPSFLNQANKAKQSEAKTYIGSMNRAQQAYYLEKDTFIGAATGIPKLGLGIRTNTTYYSYVISGTAAAGKFTNVTNQARPASTSLKAFIGGVTVGTQTGTGEATTLAILCEANDAPIISGGATGTELTTLTAGLPTCDTNYDEIK
jgi:type IV pilus assembly protein PilA